MPSNKFRKDIIEDELEDIVESNEVFFTRILRDPVTKKFSCKNSLASNGRIRIYMDPQADSNYEADSEVQSLMT